MKQPLKPKYGQACVLIALLLLALLAMALIKQSSHSNAPSPFARPYTKAYGDTLEIAIELNPSVYSVHGDSISGRDSLNAWLHRLP